MKKKLSIWIAITTLIFAGCQGSTPTNVPVNAPTTEPTATITTAPETTEAAKPTEEVTLTDVPEMTKEPEETVTPEPTEAPKMTEVPEVTPTPEATATPEIIVTPEPTATVVPTETPTNTPVPTATLAPTATPAPTSTPKPTATPKPTEAPIPEGLRYNPPMPGSIGENRCVVITGYTGTEKHLVIPGTINGEVVREIKFDKFKVNTSLESIVIPEEVDYITGDVFSACTNLKEIVYLKAKWSVIGYASHKEYSLSDILAWYDNLIETGYKDTYSYTEQIKSLSGKMEELGDNRLDYKAY